MKITFQWQITCVIFYWNIKHLYYWYNYLFNIRKTLRKKGTKVQAPSNLRTAHLSSQIGQSWFRTLLANISERNGQLFILDFIFSNGWSSCLPEPDSPGSLVLEEIERSWVGLFFFPITILVPIYYFIWWVALVYQYSSTYCYMGSFVTILFLFFYTITMSTIE